MRAVCAGIISTYTWYARGMREAGLMNCNTSKEMAHMGFWGCGLTLGKGAIWDPPWQLHNALPERIFALRARKY